MESPPLWGYSVRSSLALAFSGACGRRGWSQSPTEGEERTAHSSAARPEHQVAERSRYSRRRSLVASCIPDADTRSSFGMKLGLDGYIPPLLVFGVAFLLIAVRHFGLKTRLRKRRFATDAVIITAIVVFAGSLELEMGRTPTYQYGPVRV